MISDIQKLIDDYLKWLKEKTSLRQLDKWVEINTPYLDRHNDYIRIYVGNDAGGYLLTDDGYIITDLEQSGCKLESIKRQELLKMTINGFGVQMAGRNMQIKASAENFALKKHNLVQAMLAVNDLFYLSESSIKSLFYEDVLAWLDLSEIRFTPKVKFTGKTGYDHLFDFIIPKSKQQPERIVQTINKPDKDKAQSIVFAWIDTKENRAPDSKAYALLNDSMMPVSSAVIDALTSYDVKPIPWSRRQEIVSEFAA